MLPESGQTSKGPVAEVTNRVIAFCTDLRSTVYGDTTDKSMVHQCRKAFFLLKRDIRRTAPDFRPFEKPELYDTPESPPHLQIEDTSSGIQDPWFLVPGQSVEDVLATDDDVEEVASVNAVDNDSEAQSGVLSRSYSSLEHYTPPPSFSFPGRTSGAISLIDVRVVIKK